MSRLKRATGRRYFYGIGLGVLVSAGSIGAAAFGNGSPTVTVAPPPSSNVTVAAGLVEPLSEEISIGNLTQGTIRRMPVAEGDEVVAGQVLAELDDDDLRAVVSAAKAQFDLSRSQKEKAVNGPRPEERREAAANLRDAEAVLAMAQLTLERQRALLPGHATTAEAYDEARAAVQSDIARRDALAERLTLLNIGSRKEDIDIAEANVQLATARLQEAEATLDKSFIRAPINGTVLRILRHVGEQVSATFPSTIIVMGDISRLRVRAEIDETDVGRITLGQRAYVTADAYGGRRFPGTITEIANRMGKKAVHTEEPGEKVDAKVLDALVTLNTDIKLPIGLRVDVFVETDADDGPATAALNPLMLQRP